MLQHTRNLRSSWVSNASEGHSCLPVWGTSCARLGGSFKKYSLPVHFGSANHCLWKDIDWFQCISSSSFLFCFCFLHSCFLASSLFLCRATLMGSLQMLSCESSSSQVIYWFCIVQWDVDLGERTEVFNRLLISVLLVPSWFEAEPLQQWHLCRWCSPAIASRASKPWDPERDEGTWQGQKAVGGVCCAGVYRQLLPLCQQPNKPAFGALDFVCVLGNSSKFYSVFSLYLVRCQPRGCISELSWLIYLFIHLFKVFCVHFLLYDWLVSREEKSEVLLWILGEVLAI